MRNSRVADVMTREVVSIRPFTPYKDVVRILLEHEISAVPVVDEQYHVEGVVSQAGLIEKEAHQVEGYPEPWELLTRRGRGAQSKARAESAGSLMTAPAITVAASESLAQAARVMRRYGIKRLPVVDEAGVLVGIVSRGDLLKPFLRTDADIHDAVTRDVLREGMCVDPLAVEVKVLAGVVTLSGEMENEFVARDTARLTRELDGVVGVVDRLRARIQDRPAARPFSSPAH
jgi:CBS-domain-containing membrane protein